MKQKNIRMLLIVAVILMTLVLGGCTQQKPAAATTAPTDAPVVATAEPTVEPAAEPAADSTAAADTAALPTATPTPAKGYVYVSAGDSGRWFPLQDEEYSITVKRTLEDGKETENVVTFFANGCRMESSNCDNQDCVHQEEVTLENKDTRVLANWIICLPNQVTIELYTPDELLEMMAAQ